MTTQAQLEQNESLLGAGLMQHLKQYIQLFVSEQAQLLDVDLEALSKQVASIVDVVDGDASSEGYQAFRGLIADVAALKNSTATNQTRLTAAEAALGKIDAAWQAEIARVESESKARDTALGLRMDGVENTIANYAAARTAKDAQHDGDIAALQAAKDTIIADLQAEVTRALAKEAELQARIAANANEIDAVKTTAQTFATRSNVDSGFAAFCNGAVTELWSGRSQPDGLPTFSSVE